ncbi:ABC transporter permease [Hungatella effluvii]|uniref:ABC transporter permease n=1 Tax=Hungatella effluvii TaxID=1096246 RepID=UPI002A839D60|nr:ABC transporter permease subunit [Hungatella effluvii]
MFKQSTGFKSYFKSHGILYIMMIPALLYTAVFKMMPMYGVTIAFKDYQIFNGANAFEAIANSKWVGFQNFMDIFHQPEFLRVLGNTFVIAFLKLVVLFPLPVLLSLLLSELTWKRYKQVVQTVIYLPHFLSWIVVAGMAFHVLGTTGLLNQLMTSMGFARVNFLMDSHHFLWVLVGSDGWKEAGFNTVVYLAAISSINPDLYEAASMDGAGKLQNMFLITLPNMMPTVLLMFILKVGKLLEENFQQILVMYNPAVYDTADVIQTFVYRMGLGEMDFTMGVTVGLFNSLVSFALILFSNFLS